VLEAHIACYQINCFADKTVEHYLLLNFSLLIFLYVFYFSIKVAVTESSKMDITFLADFIAPRSVQDTSSHCKYYTTHLPKELQSLLKFSCY